MDSQPGFNLSEISVVGVLEEITKQDIVFWNKNGEVEYAECNLTQHGNLMTDIHQHFRKLQPEYCSHFFEEKESNKEPEQTNTENNPPGKVSILSDESMCDNNFPGRRKSSRRRQRYISEGSQSSGGHRLSLASSFRESSSPSKYRGLFSDYHSSVESLQSEHSYRISQRPTNINLYDAALDCCLYPVLAKTQARSSDDENSSYSDFLPTNDFSGSVSERLSKYLGNIFHVNVKKHKQLRAMQSSTRGGKRGKLEQDLRHQLKLSEEDTNPYYNPKNFSSPNQYKLWQDQERREISTLLRNQIPRLKQLPKNKDRCLEYRKILEKVMAYDVEAAQKKDKLLSDKSSSSSSYSGSDSKSHRHENRVKLLSKRGRRLLAEFAARYRIGVTTQACFFLLTVEEYMQDETILLNNVTFKALTKKLDFIYKLIEEEKPFCISEIENLVFVTGKFIQRMNTRVLTLLTVWQPTTRELRNGLEFTRAAFQVFDVLNGNDVSEWPECLSDWFEDATVEKYKECKRPDLEVSEMVLASVSHAVNVVKMMQRGKKNDTQTDYEAVFGGYISNFPHAVSTGLYDAVMEDVKFYSNALAWNKSMPTMPGSNTYYDSLDLRDIALAYKLAEFDNLVKIREIDASKPRLYERNFSWRKAYHPLAMHWLDILSCHMRKQVVMAVSQDKFDSPDFDEFGADLRDNTFTNFEENDARQDSQKKSSRLRYGSLLRKDDVEQKKLQDTLLPEVEEERDSHQHEERSIHTSEDIVHETNMLCDSFSNHVQNDALEDQTCKLISYRPLVEDEYDSTQSVSFFSCNTGGESSSLNMLKSAQNSSERTFSSAISNSDDDSTCSLSSDGYSSNLPQLVPSNIHPQKISEAKETVDGENRRGSSDSDKSGDLMGDGHKKLICNVSSSLVDVVAVVTRFLHFVETIGDTVYRLPDINEHDETSAVSLEDQNDCREARDIKDRFMQKAAQMVCGVIQQYANNILSIDVQSISRDTALYIVGRRILLQIDTGMCNGTISIEHCSGNSFLSLPSQYDGTDKGIREMIVRLNNILVLQHGMTHLWDQMEKLFERSPTVSVPPSSHPSTSSISTQSDESYNLDQCSSTSVVPDQDQNEVITSSDDVTQPSSSSACTVITRDEADDKNNNNNDDQEEEDEGSSQSSDESLKPNYENVEYLSGQWVVVDTPENSFMDYYTVSMIDFLKEQSKVHLDHVVLCVGRLVALKSGNWFSQLFNKALENPSEIQSANNKDKKETSQMKKLKSHLNSLLDMFAMWTHKEGINALHENVWMKIIGDLKQRIISLKQLNDCLCKIHAEHIRHVFTYLLEVWYRHPSKPNAAHLEWLTNDIKPSLTLLELYCMSAPSLFNVYNDCRQEQLPELTEPESSSSGMGEVVVLCKRILQDKKSFSGEMLHRTVLSILVMNMKLTNGEAYEKATELCQNLLTSLWIQFLFRKRDNESLPDVIPLTESSQVITAKQSTESISTVESNQSSVTEDSSSEESTESDMQRIFNCCSKHFYKFSEKISSIGIMDDIRRATDSSKPEIYNTFLIDLLKSRSRTDEETRSLLLEHGLIKQGLIKSCFSCFG